MPEVELSAGTVEYEDTGGDGPVARSSSTGWRWTAASGARSSPSCAGAPLRRCRCCRWAPTGCRCAPTPTSRCAAWAGSSPSSSRRLDLRDVTLCFNDWCGAQVMIADGLMDRVGSLVLVSCEAYDNYPPGLAGHAAWLSGKLPGGMAMMRQVLLRRRLRDLPFVFGQMTKHGVPDELMREWLEPMKRAEIRRDVAKYTGAAMKGRHDLAAATAALPGFDQAGARRLGHRGADDAQRARPHAGRGVPRQPPGRARRLLHADPRGPARRAGGGDPRARRIARSAGRISK